MGCNAENYRFGLLKSADFSAVFFHGQGVYLQTVQIYHKKLPRLSGIIRVHSGRTERTFPHNLRKVLPAKAHAGTFSCGCGRSNGAQQAHKKLSPVSMRGNSQNGGQTTKSLLTKPQCSGVPIQQAVSLSSSFPRHCLLFVCAFFRKMQAGARSEELPLLPPPAYKTAPASCYGNRGGSFALWVLFSGAHAKPCEGSFGKPRVCGEKKG